MSIKINSKLAIVILIIVTLVGVSSILLLSKSPFIKNIILPTFPDGTPTSPISFPEGIEAFLSEADFKTYLQKSESERANMHYSFGGGRMAMPSAVFEEIEMGFEDGLPKSVDWQPEPERVSETNVQVMGIDEPDIVKTDGKEIYFSSPNHYWRWGWGMDMIIPPGTRGKTKIIGAFPPDDLSVDEEINRVGELLLDNNTLLILSGDRVYGYDVSDPKSPEEKWVMDIEDNSYIIAARLYNGKVYLITKTRINAYRPCPIKPLSVEGVALEIKCSDIYHPVAQVPIDVTYSAVILDPQTGKIENDVSFVGSSGSSIIYMSEKGLYITYSFAGDIIQFYSSFFKEKCQDLVPSWLVEKIDKLAGYDISNSAKLVEFGILFSQYTNSLDDDERLRVGNEFTNRMSDYYKEHKRELERTGIVKIGTDNLQVLSSGSVPGEPLNQFSLDEYQDHLRIAITVGDGFFSSFIGGIGRESANDVYVLDKDLKITGSIKDLGLTEKVYSARFIGDKGYVVTFRQIDPFYVLDLSDPQNPELKGELKIPGYSSYLHPITGDKILGIGKEGSKVKLSLFDVQDPEHPTEKDKYTLDEYWSDILNTHHAFLMDKKHEIFFLPGSKGGYIFSYKGDKLSLVKAVSEIKARRAVYINDYLYIIGDDKIVVLNENNWERVKELEF